MEKFKLKIYNCSLDETSKNNSGIELHLLIIPKKLLWVHSLTVQYNYKILSANKPQYTVSAKAFSYLTEQGYNQKFFRKFHIWSL